MKRVFWVTAALLVALAAAYWLGRRPLAAALYERGLAAKDAWRLEDARRDLGLAARLGRKEARLELAYVLEDLGDLSAARRHFDELLGEETDDPRLAARLLAVNARTRYRAGDSEAARKLYDEALEAARSLGLARLERDVLHRSARIYYDSLGDLDEGRGRLERALELSRASGDAALEADVLSSLGIFYWWYERQRERSLPEFYAPALGIYERLGDRRGIAGSHSRIGLVHLAKGEYEDCARELEASRALYEELGDRRGLGDVHSYLGALYVGLENYPQAHEHYGRSLAIAEEAGDEPSRRLLEPLLADLELRRGEYARAAELYERLIAAAPDPSIELRNHLTSRGHALLRLERPAEALASYQRALAANDRTAGSDEPFRSRILTGIAHAHMHAGDLEAAAAALDEADAIGIAVKGWGETVLATLARADLADRRGDKEASLGYLLTAAEIESRTFGSALSHFFQSQYRQVFERLVSLLFDGDVVVRDRAEELAFRLLEQMRYRSFRSVLVRLADVPESPRPPGAEELEAVRRIEELTRRLEGRSGEEAWEELRRAYASYEDRVLASELTAERYRRAATARPIELAALARLMPPETALVEYVLAGERSFAVVVTRGDLTSVALPAGTPALEAKVKLFRGLVFGGEEGDWRLLAGELGRLLVAPLEEGGALDGVERLVLVPMGFLHELPFAALGTSRPGLLVERYTLSMAPSATLWAKRGASPAGRGMAAFGVGRASDSKLLPLAFAEREAEAVAGVAGGTALLGAAATETAFKALAPTARFLHVAAHGLLERRVPLHSRLRLEADENEDGHLTVREILDLGLGAELVSLSACETALSRSAGLEVDRLGFVEAFLYAGAENVLASLLPISDGPSAAFMTSFYEGLASAPPADALAAAQRSMLADGAAAVEADLSHPRYWAPFVLVGHRPP